MKAIGQLSEEVTFEDSSNATWTLRRTFREGAVEGTLSIEVEIRSDHRRQVLHFPWITLFAELGTYGRTKHQGLFAGLEYLADEPSSSEADITTSAHVRRLPAPAKLTLPLMIIEQEARYIGLTWELSEDVAAVFDSPDRIFDSKAHVMGLWAPSVGSLRLENERYAYRP